MMHQYQRLTELLRKKIVKGSLRPGDILPSENELCANHHLARSTVRQALDELVKEGYVTKQKGKGTIVLEPKRQSLGLFSIRGFSAIVGETASETRNIFLQEPHHTTWGDDFFFTLTEDEKAQGCICVKRLRMLNNFPAMLEYTYIPDVGLPLFRSTSFVRDSLFETLKEKFGIEIRKAEQELVAAGAVKETAKVFRIGVGTPLLHVYRKYHTNKAGLFIYSSFFCHTDKYSIGNTLQ